MFKYFWAVLATMLMVSFAGASYARSLSGNVRGHETPQENVRQSQWYDYVLSIDAGFRTYRKRLECVPIHDPALHRDCVGSFDVYEPIAPGYQQHHWWRSRYYSRDARQRMSPDLSAGPKSTSLLIVNATVLPWRLHRVDRLRGPEPWDASVKLARLAASTSLANPSSR